MPVLSIGNNVTPGLADRPRGRGGAADHVRGLEKPPRLAVMILPADARELRAGLRRRLRARHGIDQFQYVTLMPAEWDAIIRRRDDVPEVKRLRDRLAIAMLGRANLIAVVGYAAAGRSNGERTPR